jgi:hypothetical protein
MFCIGPTGWWESCKLVSQADIWLTFVHIRVNSWYFVVPEILPIL